MYPIGYYLGLTLNHLYSLTGEMANGENDSKQARDRLSRTPVPGRHSKKLIVFFTK